MNAASGIEHRNISLSEIEAGVRRGRELRNLYFRDLGRRIGAAWRGIRLLPGGHHGDPLTHGC